MICLLAFRLLIELFADHLERPFMASTSPLFLFAGGGTGGHLFPGLAVAAELQRREPTARIQFVGSERSLERALVIQHGYDHRTLPSEPLNQLWRRPWSFAC